CDRLDLALLRRELEIHRRRYYLPPRAFPRATRDSRGSGRRELAADLAEMRLAFDEGIDDRRIELATALREDLGPSNLPAHRTSVRTIARHRVERIGDGEDACPEGNLVAGQAVRIAASVPALVMRPDDLEPLAL